MAKYLANQALNLIRFDTVSLQSPGSTTSTGGTNKSSWPSVGTFAAHLVRGMSISRAVMVISSIYMDRLRNALPVNARGVPSTPYRILLASLIISYKCHHDERIKNKPWLRWTRCKGYEGFGFTLQEVNSMEREFLSSLDYHTLTKDQEIVDSLAPVLGGSCMDLEIQASNLLRNFLSPAQMRGECHLRRDHYGANEIEIAAGALQELTRGPSRGKEQPASHIGSTESSSPSQTLFLPKPCHMITRKTRLRRRLSKIWNRGAYRAGQSSKVKGLAQTNYDEVDGGSETECLLA
jgi:hypothetical protein